MTNSTRSAIQALVTVTSQQPVPEIACPHCSSLLVLEDLQPGTRLSNPVAHALIDHLLLIESEMAQIRRLLVEKVMPFSTHCDRN